MVYYDEKHCEMEWSVRVLYSRMRKPPPVWMDVDQLGEIANIIGCRVSRKDGGVLFSGDRCIKFTSSSEKPFVSSDGHAFIINEGKYVELKVCCKTERLARVQVAKYIAVLQSKITLPDKWILYHGYLDDMRKYYR